MAGRRTTKSEDVQEAPAEAEAVEAVEAEVEASEEAQVPALVEKIEDERAATPVVLSTLPSVGEWDAMNALAGRIASTEFVPRDLRGRPDAVLACILAGREMGLGPMQSLRQIHIIDGRPAFAADLMLAKMRSSGVMIVDSGTSPERAWIHARRGDTGEEAEVEWTLEEAKQANLLGKSNWKTYPSDMLWARCVGRLARRLGSDMFGGMNYTAEEVRDFDDASNPYSSGYSDDVTESTYFDPARELAPNAPKGWKDIDKALHAIDGTLDWAALVSDLAMDAYQVPSVKEMNDEQTPPFGRRLANLAARLHDKYGTDFPPPSPDEIMTEVEWAFSLKEGHGVEPSYVAVADTKGTKDDAPLGGGEQPPLDESIGFEGPGES